VAAAPLLEMREIAKSFPGVRALDGISLSANRGEVLALCGENGAGKSTLMKVLAGAYRADGGEIRIDGAPVRIDGPKAAESLGIGMIYQEFNLVPDLGVIENVILGAEPSRGLFLDARKAAARAGGALRDLGIALPLDVPVRRLSVAQQQLVEIAKTMLRRARIVVMDEPTAALTEREIDALFTLIARLKREGVAFIYVSHRLEELPRIADRVCVIRDGRTVETRPLAEMPRDEIVRLMVGRPLDLHFPALPPLDPEAPLVLDVRALRAAKVSGLDLMVRAGEIVGLAGLVGAGRTEVLRAIAAADGPTGGEVRIDGSIVHARTPRETIAAGIAFITEDRKTQGLVLGMSVRANATLAHLQAFSCGPMVDVAAEAVATNAKIAQLRIRTPSGEQLARNLSGGNQQKVVLAKWLLGRARVFLFDEPTRGIDVGAKVEIYALMVELLRGGAAIVMVSSELPEVLGMSHRICVVRNGKIVAAFGADEATPDRVMAAAAGTAA